MGTHDEREVDLAWDRFRVRLADRLAALEDDEVLEVEVEVGLDDEPEGAVPSLQFCGWGGDLVHAEVVSNRYLDQRYRLDERALAVLGRAWAAPTEQVGNHHQDVERRTADRLAVESVQALRDVFGVLHPAFLRADGLEQDPSTPAAVAPGPTESPALDLDAATRPQSSEQLRVLVDQALSALVETVHHDEDGDVPVRRGDCVVFVRVHEDRPAVEVFAEIVCDPRDTDRLPVELDLLNRKHPLARFATAGTAVRMSHVLPAWPFVARQLNHVVAHFLDDVEQVAADLVERVGGRLFLQEPEPEPDPLPGPLAALLELLELGPVSSPVVAHLYEGDRHTIVSHLVDIRRGRLDLGSADQERVLTSLRRGLRFAVDGEVPERRPRRLPPRPRTEQQSLLDDHDAGEDTLGFSA